MEAHAAAYTSRKLGGWHLRARPVELDRERKRIQERVRAHVAHEHGTAVTHRLHRVTEDVQEIAGVGEVLDDGVQDDAVEAPRLDAGEVAGFLLQEVHVRARRDGTFGAAEGHLRAIASEVEIRALGEATEDHAGTAADLEHAFRSTELERVLDGVVEPLLHFFERHILRVVAGSVAGGVDG
jgi:hypothetical protein